MRILLRMPNWLGDAVMATPAIDNLRRHVPQAQIVLVGSPLVAEMFQGDPRFVATVADRSRQSRIRWLGLRAQAHALREEFGPFDLGLALPNSLSSALLLSLAGAAVRIAARGRWRSMLLTNVVDPDLTRHQAEIYNQIVCDHIGVSDVTGPTTLHVPAPWRYARPTLGINPGAAYGSAKRWEPDRFAAVAQELAARYDIVIFGAPNEAAMTGEIETALRSAGVTNVENLAGRTKIPELLARIAGLDLFITNDSGPMHIAGALGIPSVAIFGATNHIQTCQWRGARSTIVRHDLPCAPCMQRTCPLGHHDCMRSIQPEEVVTAALELMA